ncbi:MAG: hypothetical protein ACERKD_18575 [Prolixibacteraceae bacterium]
MKAETLHNPKIKGRVFLWILLSLLIFFGGLSLYLYFNAEKIINDNLSDFVFEQTDSTYQLNFESIKINFRNKDITINNVLLETNPTKPKDSLKANFYFKTPLLKISQIRIWPLIKDRRFVAESFKVEQPEFEFGQNEKMNLQFLSKYQLKQDEQLHLPVFAEIFFDTLSILNAQLSIDTLFNTSTELPQINLVATHFKLGGRKFTDTPYPFDVSDLSLTVNNLNEKLPDQLHKIEVKEIQLSLLHSTITALQVKLTPVSDTLNSAENRYHIVVPEIKMLVEKISEINKFDTLSIQTMEFIDPEIQIKFGSKVKKGTPINEINFYELTGNSMQWIKVKHFSFINADIKFTPSNSDIVAQHFENMFVNFFDFLIDPTSFQVKDRILSAKDLNFKLNRFTLIHNDKVHELVIHDLKVDSRVHEISTGQFVFEPINENAKNLNTIIHMNSKGLICKRVDFTQFYHYQILPMGELLIKNPEVQIDYKHKRSIKKRVKDKSIILDKISDYLTGIYVDSTTITDGNISYNYRNLDKKEGYFRTDFNFKLTNLSIDSTTFAQSDKIFFAENFKINLEHLQLQLADETHRLSSQSVFLSSIEKSAEIIDLKIMPIKVVNGDNKNYFENKNEFFNIHFPHIQLNGANLHRAFFDKMLYIQSIDIEKPTFNIEKFGEWKTDNVAKTPYQNALYAMVSDFLFSINIRTLNMEDGVLNMVQHKENAPDFDLSNLFSIKMKNFELDANSSDKSNKLFFSDDIDLILKNHSFTLADGVHKVDAKEIGILSSEKRVYVKNAKLYPDILSDKFQHLPISVFANIPDMQITNADIFTLFNKGQLPVTDVILNRPEIKFLFQKKAALANEDKNDETLIILKDLKSVTVQRFKINQGKFEFANYEDFKSSTFATANVNFELTNFNIVHREQHFETSYSDFQFNCNTLLVNLPDQEHSLRIEQANYRLSDQNFTLKNITFEPLNTISRSDKKLFIDFKIPEIQLSKFNIRDFLKTKNIQIDNMELKQPNLLITDSRIEKKSKFSPYQLDLFPSIQSFSESLHINTIHMEEGNIELKKNQPMALNKLSLLAHNFVIDEANSQVGKLLNSDQVEFKINDLSGKTKNKYFEYKIKQIDLNTNGEFNLKGISLQPLLTAKEFARKKVYQADYFSIDNADFFGNGLDVREFIEQKNIFANELTGNFTKVKIHRDKNYPLTPNLKTKLPQEALRDLSNGLFIAKTNLTIQHFQFTEREPGTFHNSMVFVTNASAEIKNVTNVRKNLAIRPNMTAKIQGKLMDVADVTVELDMNIPSFGNEFTCKAICGKMPLSTLNPIAEPGLKLSIKEGINHKMEVYFEANEDSSIGNIRFAYNDLKISVLSARDGELKEGKFISFLVNSIALKTDNPKPGRILLPAKFVNHRDKQRSVVGYCWRSIYSGIKATMGIKEKEN